MDRSITIASNERANAVLATPVSGNDRGDPSPARLRTVDLSVHFEQRSALAEINLSFMPGETSALIGPNGAGKSTLLKALAGMQQPTHGVVLLDGEPVRQPSAQVSYVPQRSDVDWPFPISVLDVALMGRALAASRLLPVPESDRQDALSALDEVGMRHLAAVQIGALSGGQQQRVIIARALLQQAAVYLLDEPFTGVDVPTQSLVLQILDDLRAVGKTIIFATHDLAMAARSADVCVLLKRTVVAAGPPSRVLTAANLQATFGGAAVIPITAEPNA